jgi:hypothetical protein
MKQPIQRIIENTLLRSLGHWTNQKRQDRAVKKRQARELVEWERNGKPVPPPHLVKQRTLKSYSEKYGLKTLVETGTFYGEMVEAMKSDFDRIYSIELSSDLFEKAKDRFKRSAHIEIFHGDSGIELERITKKLDEPALFWLDGHYSGGETAKGEESTPIYKELSHILGSPESGHVIVIDDARLFGSDHDYPSIRELTDYVNRKRADLEVEVQDDSIRITPKR